MPKAVPVGSRKVAVASEGLRPLTKAELTKLGRSPTSRAYTSQKPGVKKLRADLVVSRRQAEQRGLELGPGGFEKLAERNRDLGGGRTFTDRYYRYVRSYAEAHDLTIAEARRDPEFRQLYRDATKTRDSRPSAKRRTPDNIRPIDRARSKRRITALRDLGVFDDDEFAELIALYQETA